MFISYFLSLQKYTIEVRYSNYPFQSLYVYSKLEPITLTLSLISDNVRNMKTKQHSYGKLNNENLKVLIRLSRITQALHKKSSKIFKDGGLTTAQFAVLEALYHKGSLTINQIIESILSSSGNMTVVVNNLEKEAFIVRHCNPNDKRSCLIAITDKGINKIEEIFPKHLKDLEASLATLTSTEKEMLVTLINKIDAK